MNQQTKELLTLYEDVFLKDCEDYLARNREELLKRRMQYYSICFPESPLALVFEADILIGSQKFTLLHKHLKLGNIVCYFC